MIPKDLRIPGYDIEVLLGKGGMAAVYKARQQSFGREVALKVLNPTAEDLVEFSRRFLQESAIVAKLHHSHIVQVYDVGQYDNYFYISMEYLHGGDLSNKLNEGLSLRDTVKIIKQLADALDFAHRKNIIHRDIKPANVMFREDGAAVLTDFGIAKELESQAELTQAGMVIGTPRYMSPEQIRGDKVDHRADIYALGIVFYRCLTNFVPFDGKDMLTTAYLQDNEPVPLLPPEVACFQPIINRMLEKVPEARFQRGHDVVDALEELDRSAYQGDLTNLAVAAANKLAPPTVTSVSGRYSVGMSALPDSNMDGTQIRASLTQTARAEHMRLHDPLAASARYPAAGTERKPRRSAMRKASLLLMGAAAVGLASVHYAGGWEQVSRSGWAAPLNDQLRDFWTRISPAGMVSQSSEDIAETPPAEFVAEPVVRVADEADQVEDAQVELPLAAEAEGNGLEEAGIETDPAVAVEEVNGTSSAFIAEDEPEVDVDTDTSATEGDAAPAVESTAVLDESPGEEEPLAEEPPALEEAVAAEPDTAEVIAGLLAEAEAHMAAWRLRKPASGNAYQTYQQVLELEPDNNEALEGIERIAELYLAMANRAINEKALDRAQGFIEDSRIVAPENPELQTLEDKLMFAIAEQQELDALAAAAKKAEKIERLLTLARADEEAGRIRSPVGNNALEKYQQILDLDPDNDLAIDKLIEYGR